MITLSNQDRDKLTKVLARAEAAELKLTVLYQSSVGAHYVVDSDHSRHHVYIWNEPEGATYECDCTAGQHEVICQHGSKCLSNFKVWLEAKKVITYCLKPGCHQEAEGEAVYCLDHELELAAAYSDLFGD